MIFLTIFVVTTVMVRGSAGLDTNPDLLALERGRQYHEVLQTDVRVRYFATALSLIFYFNPK